VLAVQLVESLAETSEIVMVVQLVVKMVASKVD
jgi:hypothetical protein